MQENNSSSKSEEKKNNFNLEQGFVGLIFPANIISTNLF